MRRYWGCFIPTLVFIGWVSINGVNKFFKSLGPPDACLSVPANPVICILGLLWITAIGSVLSLLSSRREVTESEVARSGFGPLFTAFWLVLAMVVTAVALQASPQSACNGIIYP